MRKIFKNTLEILGVVVIAIAVGIGLFYSISKTELYKIINNDARAIEQKGDVRPIIQEAIPVLYVYDDRVGRKMKPDTKIHFKGAGFDSIVVTNKDGFTGRNYPLETKNYRIAFLGDSFVESYGVADTNRFNAVFERQVYEKTKQKIEMMTFGVSGWGLVNQYGAIKHFALKYKPDEIWVSFLVSNDLGDDTPLMSPPPAGPTFIYDKKEPNKIVDIVFGYDDIPVAVEAERQRRYGKYLKDTWEKWAYGLLPYYWSYEKNERWELIMDHTYQTLRLIKELCDKNNIKLSLIYRNSGYDSSQSNFEQLKNEAHKFIGKEIKMERALGIRRFKEKLDELGIDFINTIEMPPITQKEESDYVKHFSFGDFFSDVIINREKNIKK